MLAANPFSGAVTAASSAIVHLSTLLAPVGGAVLAIIAVTIAVRLALHPLNRVAVRGERARARIAPQVTEIRTKHGKNLTQMGTELTTLYRSERISPYAGILPLLIQAPIFLLLYRVFVRSHSGLASATMFGVPLHAHFLTAAGGMGAHLLVFGLLFAGLAAVAVVTSRRAQAITKINTVAGTAVAAGAAGATLGTAEAMAKVLQFAPFFVLISGAVLPLAAGLYLLTTTAWTAAENVFLRRGLPA
jgi:YidC/Oxa1 family membrane protein insertase